jgi:EAL domain-containing protein (putative c-di-GMP-specific phosphodiesterase class I)
MPEASVLVVDDEDSIRYGIREVLRRAGYVVVECSSAEDAIEAASQTDFDLVITDYGLPGKDGVQLLEHLRVGQPACMRILLSGMMDLDTAVRAVNTAAVHQALQKPVSPQELLNAASEALGSREQLLESNDILQRQIKTRERADLVSVLESDAIALALQPILAASDESVVGYEGLLRCTHEVYFGPGPLLEGAETHGVIDLLADRVCERARGWLDVMAPEALLFLNLHPLEFEQPERLCGRLEGLNGFEDRVVLELTERSMLEGIDGWEGTIHDLTDRGFAVAVDDLGAGYSSLSTLAALQPRYIKIDMSIIRDIDSSPRKQRLVELLCNFGIASEVVVVAEGVETQAEATVLRGLGVDLLQGYFYGRPSLEPFARDERNRAAG